MYLITYHDLDHLPDRDRLADRGSHGVAHTHLIAITYLIANHDLDRLLDRNRLADRESYGVAHTLPVALACRGPHQHMSGTHCSGRGRMSWSPST